MIQFRYNVIANLIGKSWIAIVSFLLIPVYVKFLGVEAYGLVGFYASLQSLFTLFDLGFSITLNRELAQLSVLEGQESKARNLVRTLEILYWAIAVLIVVLIFIASSKFANDWVKPQTLSVRDLETSFVLMGLAIGSRFPSVLYQGGLVGLQKQILLNVINVVSETVRGLGTVLAIWLISPTIQTFFAWQIFVNLLQTLILYIYLWRKLPGERVRPQFNISIIRDTWKFTASMTVFNILVIVLLQMDKFILSKLLSLEDFAYYSLASTLAFATFMIVAPVNTAAFPKFTQLLSQGKNNELITAYHSTSQLMSVLTLPIALLLALFPKEILLLWTGNSLLADKTYIVLSFLAISSGINALVHVPYTLQFAYASIKLPLYANMTAIITLFPTLIILTNYYGALGASAVLVLLNSGYLLIVVQLMHRKIFPYEKWRWYRQSILLPLMGTFPIGLTMRILMPRSASLTFNFVWILLSGSLMLLMAAWVTPYTNRSMRKAQKYLQPLLFK
jgi:O-antigen/teichoic acid export membrane protein